MLHIAVQKSKRLIGACGVEASDGIYTSTALESDCNECRTAVGVALVNDKTWDGKVIGVNPVKKWEQQSALIDENGKVYEREKT